MKKKLVLENVTLEQTKEWFEEHGYQSDKIELGYNGYYAEGYQDADFYEITKDNERYNIYSY